MRRCAPARISWASCFMPARRRNLSPDFARALAEHLRGRVRLVALVADAGDERIAAIVEAVRPDFLQLHGSETPERIAALRSRFDTAHPEIDSGGGRVRSFRRGAL